MRVRRMAMGTIWAATLAVAVAAPARAENAKSSKSSVQAAALAKQLAEAKLQYIATKDPTDPGFKDDPGMQEWREFMAKYLPGADINDITYVFAYSASKTLMQVLKQCDGDFSRENVMRQATNLHDLELRTLLPGIKINTSPTNYRPMRALQLMKWDGKTWARFGDVIEGAQT